MNCKNGYNSVNYQIDLSAEWYIIELRIFYGYLISSMVFLMIAEINGINKQAFPPDIAMAEY